MTVPLPEPQPSEPEPRRPLPRIGDAERDRAVESLQEHMAQGRLDRQEFDDRLTRALQARTAADLQPLFDDLPEPRPSGLAPTRAAVPPPWPGAGASAVAVPGPGDQPAVAPPPGPPSPRWVSVTMGALWPATIILYIVTDFDYWWLFVIAAMVSYFLKRTFTSNAPEPGPEDPPRAIGH